MTLREASSVGSRFPNQGTLHRTELKGAKLKEESQAEGEAKLRSKLKKEER